MGSAKHHPRKSNGSKRVFASFNGICNSRVWSRILDNAAGHFELQNRLVKNSWTYQRSLRAADCREHQEDISRTEGRCRKRWERVFPEGSYELLVFRIIQGYFSPGSPEGAPYHRDVAFTWRKKEKEANEHIGVVRDWKFLKGAYPARLNGTVRIPSVLS